MTKTMISLEVENGNSHLNIYLNNIYSINILDIKFIFLKLFGYIIISTYFNCFIVCVYSSTEQLFNKRTMFTHIGRSRGNNDTTKLNENCRDCVTWSGSRSAEERKERERETDWKKKGGRENRCVTHFAISGTVDEGAACTRGGERSVSARAYSGRGRSDLTARSLPEFAPVFSTRASDGGTRARSRVHEAVYTQHARRCVPDATRDRDPRRKATRRGTRPAGRRPCARLLHFRRRRALHRDAVRALPPRVCASGTFSPLMRDTSRGHFCFHTGMQVHHHDFCCEESFVPAGCVFVTLKLRYFTFFNLSN